MGLDIYFRCSDTPTESIPNTKEIWYARSFYDLHNIMAEYISSKYNIPKESVNNKLFQLTYDDIFHLSTVIECSDINCGSLWYDIELLLYKQKIVYYHPCY